MPRRRITDAKQCGGRPGTHPTSVHSLIHAQKPAPPQCTVQSTPRNSPQFSEQFSLRPETHPISVHCSVHAQKPAPPQCSVMSTPKNSPQFSEQFSLRPETHPISVHCSVHAQKFAPVKCSVLSTPRNSPPLSSRSNDPSPQPTAHLKIPPKKKMVKHCNCFHQPHPTALTIERRILNSPCHELRTNPSIHPQNQPNPRCFVCQK